MYPIAADHAFSSPLGAHVDRDFQRSDIVEDSTRPTGPGYTQTGDAFLLKKPRGEDINLVCHSPSTVHPV